MRTAGNAVFIYSIVSPFYGELCLQGDKSLLKSNFFKEGLVDFNGIKGGISKKSLRFNKRMFLEEMMREIREEEGILHHKEQVDLLPAKENYLHGFFAVL